MKHFSFFAQWRIALVCALAALTLAGCALSPGPAPKRVQLLPALPQQTSVPGARDKQLVVAIPSAGNDIDTDAIALVMQRREVGYLSGMRWTSSVPRLMQASLIDALEASGSLRGATDESAGIAANAKLFCDIKQFSLQYPETGTTPPDAVIQATFKMVNLADGAIMSTLPVQVRVPAQGRDTQQGVAACEEALSRVLAEVTPWALNTVAKLR